MTEIVYRSDAIEVRRIAGSDPRRQVVTFDCYHDQPGFDRAAFGEAYLAQQDISAIHILTRDNDWFQYHDILDALDRVRAALAGAERVLAYGSSMGGYAAIRFADRVGAHAALALSPQYSVDRRRVPFERRWMQDQMRIGFLPAIDRQPIRSAARIIAAYDPDLPHDRQHIALISAETRIEPLLLPGAGHPVGQFLAEIGLLKPLVAQALDDDLDVAEMTRAAAARRGDSSIWLCAQAEALPAGAEAIAFAERAVALAPDDPPAHDRLARQYAATGDYARALDAHRHAVALDPSGRSYRWNHSKTLFAAGDLARALEQARELQRIAPQVAGYHRWAATIAAALGDHAGALADVEAALRMAPANRGYRWSARALGWRLRIDRLLARLPGRRR